MGNKTGWIIAGALGLVVVIVAMVMIKPESRSKPTRATLKRGFMTLKDVNTPIDLVLGSVPSDDGNAGEDYAKAFAVYRQNKDIIDDYLRDTRDNGEYRPRVAVLDAVSKIVTHLKAGARKANMEYTFVLADKMNTAHYWYPPAYDFLDTADLMGAAATYYTRNRRFEEAVEINKSVIAMGWHMTKERKLMHMMRVGLTIQADAGGGLETIYKNWGPQHADKVKGAQEFASKAQEVLSWSDEKRMVLWPGDYKVRPGDVFNIVENDENPCCKLQAVTSLALLRFIAVKDVDQKYIAKLLKEFSASSDPAIASAAREAAAFTKEKFRRLNFTNARPEN